MLGTGWKREGILVEIRVLGLGGISEGKGGSGGAFPVERELFLVDVRS